MGADRVEAVVAGEGGVGLGGLQLAEGGLRAVDHGDGHDAVELDHRAGGEAVQVLVESQDLLPVGVLAGGGLVVDGGDGRLELVGADRGGGQGPGDQGDPFGDGLGVPAGAVLLGQGDQGAVEGGCAPGGGRR